MKDNSFALAMGKIVGEAEALQKHEIRMERRRQIFGRVRNIFALLLVATVLVFAFNYRVQLQDYIFKKKPATAQTTAGATSAAIGSAQANANTRDQVVNEITK